MTKKIVFIDWNKTLSYSLFWEHLKDEANDNSKHHGSIVGWLFADNRDLIDSWMRGVMTSSDILAKMSKDTGIDQTMIKEELKYSCERMSLCSPDIERLVRELQKCNVAVVIATDNMDTFRKYTVPSLALDQLFDGILISSELGVLKDDAQPDGSIQFFDDYLRARDLRYSDAVLLDDSPDSSGKYNKLGFERVIIDSPTKLIDTLNDLAISNET